MSLEHTHLLLDLDGTVLDFQTSQREALRATVDELGVDFLDEHAVTYARINVELWEAYERRELVGSDLRVKRWARFLAAIGADGDPNEIGAGYLRRFAAGAHVIDGALDAVAALAGRMTVVAISNGFGDVQHERLRRSGLDTHLSGTVVSDEVGAAKPDPAMFDAAFALAGHPPRDQTAIVGDSLTSDMAGGRAYGITTVWVNPGGLGHAPHPAPDRIIRSIAELV